MHLKWVKFAQEAVAISVHTRRAIVGIGRSFYRPWIYPFYTPSGKQLLREFAFDHPFHNGCFIGFSPVSVGPDAYNFWATPPQRNIDDPEMHNLGRQRVIGDIHTTHEGDSLVAEINISWETSTMKPLMFEVRRVIVSVSNDSHIVDISSLLSPVVEGLKIPITKFGGIGIRLDTCLTDSLDAQFSGEYAEGNAAQLHQTYSPFLNVESRIGSDRYGLRILSTSNLPWFVRGYGLVVINPAWNSLAISRGESLQQKIRLIGYDRS